MIVWKHAGIVGSFSGTYGGRKVAGPGNYPACPWSWLLWTFSQARDPFWGVPEMRVQVIVFGAHIQASF